MNMDKMKDVLRSLNQAASAVVHELLLFLFVLFLDRLLERGAGARGELPATCTFRGLESRLRW